METKRLRIAMALHDLFVERGELYPAEAHRLLKVMGHKTSYIAVQRIFYALRQLRLIEFTYSEPGKAPIDRRYYRIPTGMEDDPRWDSYPHSVLYPSARLGALNYECGTSGGRAEEYERKG